MDCINILCREGLLELELIDMFEMFCCKGNYVVYEVGYGKIEEVRLLICLVFCLFVWFMEVYGNWDF